MSFTLPKLNYDYDALEPTIDAQTMELHHSKHHQTYVDKLNGAVEGTEWADKDIKDVIANLNDVPEDIRTAVRNNGGGHYNHTLFWEFLSPDGGGQPEGALAEDIESTFGSFEKFQEEFEAAATGQFGSGWAWLVSDGGQLKVVASANQDNPITNGQEPLLGVDVWEHAYYLKYKNVRADYVSAFWNVVDWDKVNELYEAAKA